MIDFEIDEISSSSFTAAQSNFTMRCLTPPFGMISVACSSSFCGPRNFISKVETHPSAGTIKALSAAIQLLEILVRLGAKTLEVTPSHFPTTVSFFPVEICAATLKLATPAFTVQLSTALHSPADQ